MDYKYFALYGFTILFIIYLYYLYKNLSLRENNLILFGSLLITIGYFYAIRETYHKIYKKSVNHNISKSHLILGLFLLLSSFIPINKHVKKWNIFGLVGHFILINSNFGYQQLANICLTIYYSVYTYHNGMKNILLDKLQSIGGGLILLYYIKKSIDNLYKEKEEKEKI